MICSRCRKKYEQEEQRCPHCGEPAQVKGTFQTSTVLISSGGEDLVYRSVDEVPPRLRTRLMRSTSSSNSGTILIADRRGRKEIARAMRKVPAPPSSVSSWLTDGRRRIITVLVFLCCLALIGLMFLHRW
jgi:hypothetical protein